MKNKYSEIAQWCFLAIFAFSLHACAQPPLPEASESTSAAYQGFRDPQRVEIRGYKGEAMEPFITHDGQYLIFNNSNDPRTNTNLQYAARVDDLTFDYRGELHGANSTALDGVPSLDRDGNLFFISTRSYGQTLSTLYFGQFNAGEISDVRLVPDISLRQPGMVMFDAEIADDGNTLLVVDGRFTGDPIPKSADITIATRDGKSFRREPNSPFIMKNINTSALEYAPAISSDLLELFFTRILANGDPAIFRSARRKVDEPFDIPQKIGAITGFVEGPTLSADGRTLYYHQREDGLFAIYRVTR
jgi:hypothetical protein